MSSAVTQYRRRLKEQNPDKYAEYLTMQKMRAKKRRDEMKKELKKRKPSKACVEKKEKQKAQARERQKKYMLKKKNKEEGEANPNRLIVKITGQKNVTRFSKDRQRLYWRAAKQKERDNMSRQKKAAIREKDRIRKRKKVEEKLDRMEKTKQNQRNRGEGERAFTTNRREWNITSMVRSKLPQSPEKFAQVVSNLIRNSTPRKRMAISKKIEKSESRFSKSVSRRLQSSFKTREDKTALRIVAKKLLRNASVRAVSKQTGLSRKAVDKVKRALPRKKSLKVQKQNSLVKKFFYREDISRVMPQRRYAKICGPGYLLQVSLKAAYAQFKGENPEVKVSFSKFASLRPPNVRLLKSTHREFCLCVYCSNVRYKLLALSRLSTDKNKKITNETDLPSALLCEKSDGARFHSPACINGTCKECSFDLETTVRQYFNYIPPAQEITWNHWTKVTENNGKTRRVLLTKTEQAKELVSELVEDVVRPCVGTTFIQHLFIAHWQLRQYNHIKNNLPESCALTVMDFAKNRTISYQDEIKSAYFGAKQVTLHPIVVHYNKEGSVIRDSLVFVSDDICHDHHAVQHFKTVADTHIQQALAQKPRQTIIFSDGCSSQYKSKGPFADLSLTTSETNRNYFGSEHGKCESDGETGVINRALDRAILSRKVVLNDARDIFNYCVENLALEEPLSQRHFFYVSSEEINRNRPYTEVKTLPQTRKIHQMKNILGKPYNVEVRNLSCFCEQCFNGDFARCVNRTYVKPFMSRVLKHVSPPVNVEEEVTELTSDQDAVQAAIEALADDTTAETVEQITDNTGDELLLEGLGSYHTEETQNVPETDTSYAIGSYIKVRHGTMLYPAVVVATPDGWEDPIPAGGVYGQYFEPIQSQQWRLDDTVYLLTREEITGTIDPPNIVANATRISFKFNF